VKISTEIDGLQKANKKLKVNTIIKDANQNIVYSEAKEILLLPHQLNNIETEFQIANPGLWSIENPNLYDLTVQLIDGRKILDSYETSVGIRSIRFDPDHGFFLNNKHVKLKGTNNHHDGGPLGAACYDYTFERQLRILKSLGSNAIRVSHNPPAPELLYWADRLGFLVIDEIFDEWENGKRTFGYAPSFKEWYKKDVSDWIRRDRNHPSVIARSLGNESPEQKLGKEGVSILTKLIETAELNDNSRPFTAACNEILAANESGFSSQLGIVGYNYQEPNYKKDHLTYPSRIIYGSETVIYPYQPGDGFPLHSYEQWVEGQVEDYIAGEFLWTGFDYLGEAGIGLGGTGLEPWNTWPKWPYRSAICGLVDICGFEIPAYWFRKALWDDEPQVYIAVPTNRKANNIQEVPFWGWPEVQAHWNDQNIGELFKVQVYTNCKEVELFLNGKSLGSKNYDLRKEAFLTWDVAYEPGNIEAIGTTVNGLKTSFKIQTSDVAAKMVLTSERETIKANKQDVSYFKLELVDENNIPVPFADNLIHFTIKGPGKIAALGNGDPQSHTSFKGEQMEAYLGKCLAIVQSTSVLGEITLTASSEGMEPVSVSILTEK
jgi:beta-galactosidase